jgi:ribonuclease P protein component
MSGFLPFGRIGICPDYLALRRRTRNEAYLSAKYPPSVSPSRLPSPHVNAGRPFGDPGPPPEGSEATISLIWRIRDRTTFESIRVEGKTVRAGGVSVRYVLSESDDPPRVAFAVPRSVGSAVLRNRLRRQARAGIAAMAERTDAGLGGGAFLVRISGPEQRWRTESPTGSLERAFLKIGQSSNEVLGGSPK